MSTKWTAPRIRAMKGKQRIAMLTAYDYTITQLMDEAGIPILLVGDSLGMTVLGYENTLPVTLEQMLHHSAAVARGAKNAMVIADLPFLTYQVSVAEAVLNAGRCIKEAGVDGVKLEGGEIRAPHVKALVENGIPVLGHIGLLPQSVHAMGGFRVQGKTESDVERLINDARSLEDAGIFALVLEGMPSETARRITEAISVPTIGIGAGPQCDGQVMVLNDLLGLTERPPKFAKKYTDLRSTLQQTFATFKEEVETAKFPAPEHEY